MPFYFLLGLSGHSIWSHHHKSNTFEKLKLPQETWLILSLVPAKWKCEKARLEATRKAVARVFVFAFLFDLICEYMFDMFLMFAMLCLFIFAIFHCVKLCSF